jgi:hypothetical protein
MVAFAVVVAAFGRANAARACDLVIFGEPSLTSVLEVLGGTRTERGGAEVLIFKSPTRSPSSTLHLQIFRTSRFATRSGWRIFACPRGISTELGLKSAKWIIAMFMSRRLSSGLREHRTYDSFAGV